MHSFFSVQRTYVYTYLCKVLYAAAVMDIARKCYYYDDDDGDGDEDHYYY